MPIAPQAGQPFNSCSAQTCVLYLWIQKEAILSCIMFDYNKNMRSLSVKEFGKLSVVFPFPQFWLSERAEEEVARP